MEPTSPLPKPSLASLQQQLEDLRLDLNLAHIAKKKLAVELEE